MEPLRDPNPSDLLEVREPSELVVPQGLSWLSYNLPEHLITSSSINPGCGLRWGIWPWEDALIRFWCCYRTWTTASFPNGMQSWSWMRNEGKGGNKRNNGDLESQSHGGGSWGVTWSRGQGRVQLRWAPGILQEEGSSHITGSQCSPVITLGDSGTACGSSLSQPSCFPGGTSSGSGNRESYSGCSSECTKGKGFRSRNLKLPHFSLSQMMVRLGKGMLVVGVQMGRSHKLWCLSTVESLLITPYLPVVAFGRPLPKLTPQ